MTHRFFNASFYLKVAQLPGNVMSSKLLLPEVPLNKLYILGEGVEMQLCLIVLFFSAIY